MFIVVVLSVISLGSNQHGFFIHTNGKDNQATTDEPSQSNEKSTFVINIRGISSYSEKNMIAMIDVENEVMVKKVDLSKAKTQPGDEDSFSPNKMIDVEIKMEKSVAEGSEVKACVIQLGNDRYGQSITCNIAYATKTQSGEPQKIIVSI